MNKNSNKNVNENNQIKQDGFTLIEVIIVLAVIAILGGIVKQTLFKDIENSAHVATTSDFIAQKLSRALHNCSLSQPLIQCTKDELIDKQGLPIALSVGAWIITPSAHSALAEIGFTEISDPSPTMALIIADILEKNAVSSASATIVGDTGTLTFRYQIK